MKHLREFYCCRWMMTCLLSWRFISGSRFIVYLFGTVYYLTKHPNEIMSDNVLYSYYKIRYELIERDKHIYK